MGATHYLTYAEAEFLPRTRRSPHCFPGFNRLARVRRHSLEPAEPGADHHLSRRLMETPRRTLRAHSDHRPGVSPVWHLTRPDDRLRPDRPFLLYRPDPQRQWCGHCKVRRALRHVAGIDG